MRRVLDVVRGPVGALALTVVVSFVFLATEFELFSGEVRGFDEWESDEFFSFFMVLSLSLPVLLLLLANRGLERARRRTQEAEARAQRMALQDPLTGLPNRRFFHQHVEAAEREGTTEMAVLLLDLDRFKPVNDLRGHGAGDLLLVQVAGRLRRLCPEEALVARLGGDEFAVVLTGPKAATRGGLLARRINAALSERFDFGDWSAAISCSIGVAAWEEGMSSSELLRRADQAMYRAKQDGRNGHAPYDEALGEALRGRAALEQDLRRAVDEGAITPWFQPIYGIAGNELRSLEVLARWVNPGRGFVPPDRFVPLAEELGLIDRLSDLVLDRACAALAGWPTSVPISFNLSPCQLSNPGLPRRLLSILERHGLTGHRLEIEITETAVLSDPDAARQTLEELAAAGVRIALDDFGVGTSSLALLRALPLDTIKIDRSFISRLDQEPDKGKIVAGVLALAESLDLEVTAEGIERTEELAFLRERRCAQGQGYLLGRPQPAQGIEALLAGEPAAPAAASRASG